MKLVLSHSSSVAAGAKASGPGPRVGFTLIELIIVIIILGIVAALAIPQFTTSTQDAKESTLKADLITLRKAIQLYYQEHGNYPGFKNESGTPANASEAGVAFVAQLTKYTKGNGATSTTRTNPYNYGPYVAAFPPNPLASASADADAVTVVNTSAPLTADASPTTGWKASSATGEIIANASAYQSW